jgi:hypothetical protein
MSRGNLTASHLDLRALYGPPPVATIAEQLPAVGRHLAEALEGLAGDPTLSRAGAVLLQVNGAAQLVRRLQEAIQRQGSAPDGEAP